MFDEMCREKNARRVRETHNNKRSAFRALSFTEAGMTFLTVEIENVSLALGIMTFMDATCRHRG